MFSPWACEVIIESVGPSFCQVLVEIVFDAYNLPVDIKIDMSQGHTSLIYAAKEGQVALVEMFCRRGADLELCDVNNMTALHWAGEVGVQEIAPACRREQLMICLAFVGYA